MFEYSVADWAGIFGLVLPFSLICYLALALTAKLMSKIFRYDFKSEWPSHWIAVLLSPLASFGVLVFMIFKTEDLWDKLYRYSALGELPSSMHLWIGGVMGTLIAISIAHSLKKTD